MDARRAHLDHLKWWAGEIKAPSLELFNRPFYIFGGTGFIGLWITHVLDLISEHLQVEIQVNHFNRSEVSYRTKNSRLKIRNFKWDMNYPSATFEVGNPNIFYLANNQSEKSLSKKIEINLNALRETLNNPGLQTETRFLYASSGAIYSAILQNENQSPVSEYALTKYACEKELEKFSESSKFQFTCARLFAFYGTNLPLHSNFFIGNLMRSAITKEKFIMNSTGDSIRSYLYGLDMATQMIELLSNNTNHTYDIGGTQSVKLSDLATQTSNLYGFEVEFGVDKSMSAYLPTEIVMENRFGAGKKFDFWSGFKIWHENTKFEYFCK